MSTCVYLRAWFGSALRNTTLREISQCVQKRWSHSDSHVLCRSHVPHQSGIFPVSRRAACIHPCHRLQVIRNFKTKKSLKVMQETSGDGALFKLFKPFCFTIAVCSASFTGAMIWQYEIIRYHAHRIMKGVEHRDTIQRFIPRKSMGFRAQINERWNMMSPGQKVVAGVVACNAAVLLLWKMPSMHPFLYKYFSCHPGSSVYSMVLSAFSHFSFIHFGCNMYVLWSFSTVSLNMLGKEQLAALYLSGAAVSSMASLVNKVLRRSAVTSLGASGAILAVIGAVCYTFPESRLSIAFVGEIYPHSFSASNAIKALIVFDLAGLVLGWRIFDHAAHLGGVLFGMWYVKYGKNLIWEKRETVMSWWHRLRGS